MARRRPPTVEELTTLVAEQRTQIRALQARVRQLEARLAVLGEPEPVPVPPGEATSPRPEPPPWVKANVQREATTDRSRRPRAPVPGRRREQPDRIVVHAPAHCPSCWQPLTRGRVVQRRQVIDVPPVRVEITEHRVLERRCPRCGTVCRGTMPDLRAQVGAQRRVSWGIAALVAVLRTKLRLPISQVQWLLEAVWGLHLAHGEVCALLAEAARAGEPAYGALLAEARASPTAHADETGWRENGQNGYIWTVSTPTLRLFHFVASRAGQVIRDLLGPDYAGVTVSDFYRAYDQLDGPHQRCWAHFLRDVHKLTETYPRHAGLAVWAEAVQVLYRFAVAWAAQAAERTPAEREAMQQGLEGVLLAVCRAQEPETPQATLCARVERHHGEFFTFVAVPGVAPTNNAAERALRPLVIARKISGGTRSPHGSRTRMILQSLIATWDVRGQDLLPTLLDLLRSPRDPSPTVAQV
jgi:uncharacterized coiled-coil protein SlyX